MKGSKAKAANTRVLQLRCRLDGKQPDDDEPCKTLHRTQPGLRLKALAEVKGMRLGHASNRFSPLAAVSIPCGKCRHATCSNSASASLLREVSHGWPRPYGDVFSLITMRVNHLVIFLYPLARVHQKQRLDA